MGLSMEERIRCDYLVVGAGVAGLRAAIELAGCGSVLVVAKDRLRESSSEYAQGGIAAALSDDDEVGLHEQDTINAGAGLCDRAAVRALVEDGPRAIEELIEWGAEFDRDGARLLFAREGAHSRNRVLHAHGDSTGREIARTLYRKAGSLPGVEFRSFSAITDLIPGGAVACDREHRARVTIQANAVLLATGGLGRVFKETTNPAVATGDGVAAAFRAGAGIADIEFVQFHPTALFLPDAPRFLLTEALRGEGAFLRNAQGDRFMPRYHPLADLAPRDVVSRSIVSEMHATGAAHVLLDMTHLPPGFVRSRFPRVYETCLCYGLDLAVTPAPVHPAAHYSMGGVRTDLDGRTTLPGLYAAGEVACSGVHGANRLASNSLLEGLVFGARAGRAMLSDAAVCRWEPAGPPCFPQVSEAEIRDLAWEHCGLVRSGKGLGEAVARLAGIDMAPCPHAGRGLHEKRNLLQVALLIARCALARRESRGAQYREDYPQSHAEFQKHSHVRKDGDVTFA